MKNESYHPRISYSRDQVIRWLEDRMPKIDWQKVASELPLIVWRHRWDQYAREIGLPYSRRYMQNLDSAGKGPAAVVMNKERG